MEKGRLQAWQKNSYWGMVVPPDLIPYSSRLIEIASNAPGRSGARSEVEFYIVFVLVEPGIEQERFSCMRAPRRRSWFLSLIRRDGARLISCITSDDSLPRDLLSG